MGLRRLHKILAIGLLGWVAAALTARAENTADGLIAQGRQVYIAEGCIHCHSQFVRPGTADVELWGPARELAEVLKESPPLLGNRRQGPDLANVGNRRTREWNRLHLQAPRSTSPGSRMPNYAHLFADGDSRGEALLAYLDSLGHGTFVERAELVSAWQPDFSALIAGDSAAGAKLFSSLCVNCHGASGRGDGVLGSRLSLAPPNWPEQGWRHVTPGALERVETVELARLIKFGSPATPMAGHETLTARELADLVAYVRTLARPTHPGGLAAN